MRCISSCFPHFSPTFGFLLQQLLERILAPKPPERRDINDRIIKTDKAGKNPKIAPDMAVKHTEPLPKLVPSGVLTKLTNPTGTNLHIPARLLDIPCRVTLTRHPGGSGEPGKLATLAHDRLVMNRDGQKRFKQVMKRGEPIHPTAPERR